MSVAVSFLLAMLWVVSFVGGLWLGAQVVGLLETHIRFVASYYFTCTLVFAFSFSFAILYLTYELITGA
jgi:hypothetical protein